MGLSYHFTLSASETVPSDALEKFLFTVELEAKRLGFEPTAVLNVEFDTAERREFARRLTSGLIFEHELLKEARPEEDQAWSHSADSGSCRLVPARAVVLVLTDEQGVEYCFGFFLYPARISLAQDNIVIEAEGPSGWTQTDFIDSPDVRFREIIGLFREAGYVTQELDEFAG